MIKLTIIRLYTVLEQQRNTLKVEYLKIFKMLQKCLKIVLKISKNILKIPEIYCRSRKICPKLNPFRRIPEPVRWDKFLSERGLLGGKNSTNCWSRAVFAFLLISFVLDIIYLNLPFEDIDLHMKLGNHGQQTRTITHRNTNTTDTDIKN